MEGIKEFIRSEYETLMECDCVGSVASYIPELAKVNPSLCSIAFCDVTGQEYAIGDAQVPFCLQSCIKPFLYGLARSLRNDVHEHVGYEPSGQKFNAFVLDTQNKPHNPMINSGAIVTSSLIFGDVILVLEFFFKILKVLGTVNICTKFGV